LLGWLLGYPPLARFASHANAAAQGIAAAVPMLFALAVSVLWRPRALEPLFEAVDDFLVPMFRHWTIAELALVSALAGIGEEMLFRGVLQPAVAAHLGTVAGITIVGLIFGAVHAINLLYFLFATVVGCYLGLVVVMTDNLLTAMVAHGVYDFAAVVYLARRRAPVA
jgi:membrane protease YdiL (CAAX protease family)